MDWYWLERKYFRWILLFLKSTMAFSQEVSDLSDPEEARKKVVVQMYLMPNMLYFLYAKLLLLLASCLWVMAPA